MMVYSIAKLLTKFGRYPVDELELFRVYDENLWECREPALSIETKMISASLPYPKYQTHTCAQ